MGKKNISPNPQQPVDRVPTGQLPSALAELSEEAIGFQALSTTSGKDNGEGGCSGGSYGGDEE